MRRSMALNPRFDSLQNAHRVIVSSLQQPPVEIKEQKP
jgi:hypothetical protein